MARRPTSPRDRDELGDIASAAAERSRAEKGTPLPPGVDHPELRRIESLKPYPNNARTHSDKQVKQIVASMREFGWTIPILVDEDDTIIAGHGRVMAAKKLGMKDAPVIVARGWSAAQKRAYILADNQLTLNAGWDSELLAIELHELEAVKFNLDVIGFSPVQLKRLLAPDGEAEAELGNDLTYQIIVVARDELHQAELLAKFELEGLECRPLIS